ncbi:MAG: hypothetical protein BGN85_05640 [Alphaproteobacteria bacterium 64-11]|nr:hypothetical protein [Alphaproteobacteria bacterium]OJU10398.1 MAG: hypothetical protein BGN85_05640 [Alphaproteobacteria bacterium 64-11]
MKKTTACTIACLLPLLAACTSADFEAEGALSPHAGEAVRRNIAAQLVNPQAPTGAEAPAMNGERAALAQDAYAKDQVKKPENVMLSTGGSGGGNSGGMGGGAGMGGGGAGVAQ